MRHRIVVNEFEVEFYDQSHPAWTTIKHRGEEIARIDHREIKDLEYALGRIRSELRVTLPENYKHEA